MTSILRSYEASVADVKPGERSVVSKIGGMAVDRHRTIIDPKGIDLTSYRNNPVVLWEHGRDPARGMMPIGKNKWIKTDGDHLIAKTVFRDDAYSQELFRAYQDGDLRGWSVNVLSRDASPPTMDDERAAPAPGLLERCDLIYRKTELAEYSGVAIPSHRDALTILASRGIWLPDEARALALSRYITHTDGTWTVHAEDGKHLGSYSSEGEAKKRLEQVEWFKAHPDADARTMTDSEGGLASGGAAVKPARIRKVGAKYVVHDDDGKPISEHDDPDEAQEAAGGCRPKRSVPEPTIESDGQTWTLRAFDGTVILASEDARLVEQAASALKVSRTFDDLNDELTRSSAQRNALIEADVKAMLDLAWNGRV